MRWAIFVSGRGSNLQNVLDLEKTQLKNQKVELVLADKDCPALERAKKYSKKTVIIPPREHLQMHKELVENKIDAIFLLGYMRILKEEFLRAWTKPLVNLHPSLLPKYKGLHAIERAFEAKDTIAGVTLHEVIAELDAGPILKQLSFQVPAGISLEAFEEMIHANERKIVSEYLLDLERKA